MSRQKLSLSEKIKIFTFKNHTRYLQSFYQKEQLADTVLVSKIDNYKVSAHRNVLAAFSNYFKELKEAEAESHEIELDVDGETLELVIDFMYKGVIKLLSDNISRIITAAQILQISSLKVGCFEFFAEVIDLTNWLSIASIAEQHKSAEIHKIVTDFLLLHFEEARKNKDFLKLAQDDFREIISSDDLWVDSVETLFSTVMSWVQYDIENREKCMPDLLLCAGNLSLKQNENTWDTEILGHVSGQCLPPAPTERRLYGATVKDKKLFLAGGVQSKDKRDSDIVECIDLRAMKWKTLPSMIEARQVPAMAVLNGNLYVIGGYREKNWLRLVEKYDFDKLEWQEVKPMHFAHSYVKVAVLDGLLYAIGIDQGQDSPIEYYNPIHDKWTQMSHEHEISKCFGIAAVNGHLYAVGGRINEEACTTVERFNLTTETWAVIMPSLKVAFRDFQCVSWRNRLIACGGVGNPKFAYDKTVEEFNPQTNEWKNLATLVLDDRPLHYGSGDLLAFTK